MTRALHLAGGALFAFLACGLIYAGIAAAQDSEDQQPKPMHAIKEVMHGAHVAPEGGKSLRDRVIAGDASPEETHKLLDLYISLAENKPPKGELAEFQKKTRGVILAAAKVAVGREGAGRELARATNCAACHRDHKPPAQ
jgi:hypothetical protein